MHDHRSISGQQKTRSAGSLGLMQVAILRFIDSRPDKAYGTAIAAEVSSKIGRELLDAQVYVALGRLEDRGLLESHVETSSQAPVPGTGKRGRPRKMYALTAEGRGALENAGTYYPPNATPSMQSLEDKERQHEDQYKTPWLTPVVA